MRTKLTALLLVLALACAPVRVWAEETDVVPLELNAPAPFAGILMTEARALEYARLSLDNEELRGRIGVRDRLVAELTEKLAEARAAVPECAACEGPGFFEKNGFLFGFLVGVVGAGLLVYASVSVLETR